LFAQRHSSFFIFFLVLFVCFSVAKGNGKVGNETFLEKHLPTLPTLGDRRDAYDIHFEWDANFGIPGAFYIRNYTYDEFFLVSVTLEDIPNHGTIHFVCNSWVYNFKDYDKKDRIFFANKVSVAPLFIYICSLNHFLNEKIISWN